MGLEYEPPHFQNIQPWVQTYQGKHWDLLTPDPMILELDDISYPLSKLCRFTCHCRGLYSVAQHSVLVCRRVEEFDDNPQLLMAALFHDAHEVFCGDVSSPVKKALQQLGGDKAWNKLEMTQQRAVAKWLDIDPALFTSPLIKQADVEMLVTEKRDLFLHDLPEWNINVEPLDQQIIPWSRQYTESTFRTLYYDLRYQIRHW